jgi:hypothetical protein
MNTQEEYIVSPALLNQDCGSGIAMDHQDETYPIPCEWLKANASRFYFTDAQILDAAQPELRLSSKWDAGGIYFLIRNGKIIYVGKSHNLSLRINQHRRAGVDFDSLTWFEAPQFYLRDIESHYIHRIKPSMNTDTRLTGDFHRFVTDKLMGDNSPANSIEAPRLRN